MDIHRLFSAGKGQRGGSNFASISEELKLQSAYFEKTEVDMIFYPTDIIQPVIAAVVAPYPYIVHRIAEYLIVNAVPSVQAQCLFGGFESGGQFYYVVLFCKAESLALSIALTQPQDFSVIFWTKITDFVQQAVVYIDIIEYFVIHKRVLVSAVLTSAALLRYSLSIAARPISIVLLILSFVNAAMRGIITYVCGLGGALLAKFRRSSC